ncbi:tellurium resistance protein [Celeribacter sp.]|uniref:SLAC1 family transporter n=1 Tax=Celeribacter sp. TaxID=1890673 RepID=UPI003A94AF78
MSETSEPKKPYFPPPPPLNTPPKGLWRATPPAIFPPMLGLLGMGLAWRQAGVALNAPTWIGEMILGAVCLLYVFGVIAYKAKVARRPSVVADDLRILPGRAGLSAGTGAGMLFAAALVPFSIPLAKLVLVVSLIGHAIVALLIIRSFMIGPAEQRRVTPVWHLSFVGFIIGGVAAPAVGWSALAQMLLVTTLPIAAAIWLISALQFTKADVPPPLRPLLAIHLAPVALFGIVAAGLGYAGLAVAFGWLGITVLVVMLLGVRYFTKGEFTALWGAFTFPMAAFANLMFAAAKFQETPFAIIGGLELVAATLAISVIAFKIMQIWARGKLSKATNAATI